MTVGYLSATEAEAAAKERIKRLVLRAEQSEPFFWLESTDSSVVGGPPNELLRRVKCTESTADVRIYLSGRPADAPPLAVFHKEALLRKRIVKLVGPALTAAAVAFASRPRHSTQGSAGGGDGKNADDEKDFATMPLRIVVPNIFSGATVLRMLQFIAHGRYTEDDKPTIYTTDGKLPRSILGGNSGSGTAADDDVALASSVPDDAAVFKTVRIAAGMLLIAEQYSIKDLEAEALRQIEAAVANGYGDECAGKLASVMAQLCEMDKPQVLRRLITALLPNSTALRKLAGMLSDGPATPVKERRTATCQAALEAGAQQHLTEIKRMAEKLRIMTRGLVAVVPDNWVAKQCIEFLQTPLQGSNVSAATMATISTAHGTMPPPRVPAVNTQAPRSGSFSAAPPSPTLSVATQQPHKPLARVETSRSRDFSPATDSAPQAKPLGLSSRHAPVPAPTRSMSVMSQPLQSQHSRPQQAQPHPPPPGPRNQGKIDEERARMLEDARALQASFSKATSKKKR